MKAELLLIHLPFGSNGVAVREDLMELNATPERRAAAAKPMFSSLKV